MRIRIGLIALGAFAVTLVMAGLWVAGSQSTDMAMPGSSPMSGELALLTVISAGLMDGINPCAFTLLLLFIATLSSLLLGPAETQVGAYRRRLLGLGGVYIGAIFLTYLFLGLGLLAFTGFLAKNHLTARLGAVVAIGLGLWNLKDFFIPDLGPRLQAPKFLAVAQGQWARKASFPAMGVAGILVGLCTVPCSGAIYLAVLSMLVLLPSMVQGLSYLVIYNLAFVAPLVTILALASTRPTLNRLAHWNLHHREWVRLSLGIVASLIGLAILALV